jgi:phosphoglycolate phosphatase-like HAD superfamily hydrolase
MARPLPSWNDGPARRAVVEFVHRVTGEAGEAAVPAEDRVAVFDNDGTLWCEKPAPIQLLFILRRLAAMADEQPELRGRQPWKAAREQDGAYFSDIVAAHYTGDDSGVPTLAAGILGAYAGVTVEDFEAEARSFLLTGRHPSLGRTFVSCAYAPMVELLDHLRANGFTTYVASGGGRDFMRPISQQAYGIPREQVIGSSTKFDYVEDASGGRITHRAEPDYLNDGAEKPVRIWSRIGRRPLLAAGNSNGDIQMLRYTRHADKPTLRLLVNHDDADREFAYAEGAERALAQADAEGWTVVSMRHDWATVF